MKALKRILSIALILLFILSAVFISYTGIKNGAVVYATVNDDSIYVPLRSESDAVKAFQAYCKSRDLTIEGSLTDAITTFTTGAFNSACNEIGIDITELQAEIKAEYDQSGEPVKFFFNDTGVMAMNRIFAQFLQDNELDVGDEDVNKTAYNGYLFTDANGISCLTYVINTSNPASFDKSNIECYGTYYCYPLDYIKAVANDTTPFTFTANPNNLNSTITYTFYNVTVSDNETYVRNTASGGYNYEIYYRKVNPYNGSVSEYIGEPCVYYNKYNNKCYVGTCEISQNSTTATFTAVNSTTTTRQQASSVIIISPTINNNTYEGDTYITNEGDVINNNPDNPDNPDFPDYPEEPTGTVDDWGAEMPNLNIPWYLQGKEEKFPWNIPFNIMLTLSLLKAEPQAPHFEGTMDFKFTTYDYEIDLSQFDDVAQVLRKMEVIAFLIGLMVLTKNLIGW